MYYYLAIYLLIYYYHNDFKRSGAILLQPSLNIQTMRRSCIESSLVWKQVSQKEGKSHWIFALQGTSGPGEFISRRFTFIPNASQGRKDTPNRIYWHFMQATEVNVLQFI